MIPAKLLEKYKKLHWDKYRVRLSDEEAIESATHFLNLMKILIYPNRKNRP